MKIKKLARVLVVVLSAILAAEKAIADQEIPESTEKPSLDSNLELE